MALRSIALVLSFVIMMVGCALFHNKTARYNCKSYRIIEADSVIPIPKVLLKIEAFIDSIHSIKKWNYGMSNSKFNSSLEWNVYCTINEIDKDSIKLQFNYSVGSYRLFSGALDFILPSLEIFGYHRLSDVNIFIMFFEDNPKVDRNILNELFPYSGVSKVSIETIVDCKTKQLVHNYSQDYIARYCILMN